MRSIGAWKIKKLKKIVDQTMGKYVKGTVFGEDWQSVESEIKAQIPADWYETWECAWSEINRLVNDMMADWRKA